MIWSERQSLTETKQFVENKFKEVYPYTERNGDVFFSLPDGCTMKVVLLGGDFHALVLDYTVDDGDLYFIEDYKTPDELFKAMLEETKS